MEYKKNMLLASQTLRIPKTTSVHDVLIVVHHTELHLSLSAIFALSTKILGR